MKSKNKSFKTKIKPTWCPGCPNFMILEAVDKTFQKLINEKYCTQKDFCITTDIGCNSKIYDYLDVSGIYGLHGRSLATALGIKLGNPKLKVVAFQGDGGVYSEGIEHFIHSFRYNPDLTLIVHDNQIFSLTTGQPTPTTQKGEKTKIQPMGEFNFPLNPIKIALASGATFIARCNPADINKTSEILKKAIKHKGFAYVEIMQKCLIFNRNMNDLDSLMYNVPDCKDLKKAEKLANEWDYNSKKGKIPLGILYQSQKREPTLEEKWPQLKRKLK